MTAPPLLTGPGTAPPRAGGAALGLGALGGAATLALAGLALWLWPQLLGERPPAAVVAVGPAAAPAPRPGTATAPITAPVTPPITPPDATNAATAVATPASTPAQEAAPASAARPPVLDTLPPRAQLLGSETLAWRELGQRWGQTLVAQDPCTEAQAAGLQCFRTWRMTLHGLQRLDRPAVLTLQAEGGPARALLTALDGEHLSLQAGDLRWRMTPEALEKVWRGEYATLWRTPPGTTRRLGNVDSGPAVQWLDERLQGLQADGRLPADASSFAARLQRLQQAEGIEGGGKATPTTFMRVNHLSGVDEPRLQAPAPGGPSPG